MCWNASWNFEALPEENMVLSVTNMFVKNIYCDNVAGDSKNDLLMEAAGFIVQVLSWIIQAKSVLGPH